VATLAPIGLARFRVEGAPVATYLESEMVDGKIRQVFFQRGETPKAVLVPTK
jgi:hypothetical protein